MQDFADSDLPKRRASDYDENGNAITLQRTWERGGLAHTRIGELSKRLEATDAKCAECVTARHAMERAFLKDDLGTVDYEGHRQAHRAMVDQAKLVNEYKTDATKGVIKSIVAFLGGALLLGFVQWIKDNIR